MKVFKTSQIKQCDEYTILHEPIYSIDLMERAVSVCFEWLKARYSEDYTYYIFCGKGNNGGDGLALARMLLNENYKVQTFVINSSSDFSEDASVNFEKYPDSVDFIEGDDFTILEDKAIIIDALFGIGLNKPLEGMSEVIVKQLNSIQAKKIAIDIPSGLFADEFPKEQQTIFKADHTLTFGFYKRTFLHVEGSEFAGKVHVLDIGLSNEFIEKENTSNYIISEDKVFDNFKNRNPLSNKGNYGKTVLIGGSYGKMGSINLSTQAALRTGTGLVFTLAPSCGCDIMQISEPEAMFISGGDKFISKINLPSDEVTLGIGPGMDKQKETKEAFGNLLNNFKKPMVLDADALNIISEDKKLMELLCENTIITPHPKEFERLFGKTSSSLEQCELARKKAKEFKIIIVLKGHNTSILTPDGNCYYNITGNAGMAKGGSGDVLTGIITGLLAQGYSPVQAAIIGVYIHGKAGDYAAEKFSQEAMTAQNITHCLADVFKYIHEYTNK
ncbi:NAD(P)H-hydrate dehydratase [Apibacter sp. HY039]|uniref:NAD(P)H-hydrate dehydratase n=1 Tax=Apibacter sp. HY039 TaxID=2501476 RepID=UPI000FEBA371|nr:NAD(P)H-hydrate dehydratase [Apibacter sp. HY039]